MVSSLLNMGYLHKGEKATDPKTGRPSTVEAGETTPDDDRPAPTVEHPEPTVMPHSESRGFAKPIEPGKKPPPKQLRRDQISQPGRPSDRPRRASQAPPPGETVAHRRARLLRELTAGREQMPSDDDPFLSWGGTPEGVGQDGDILARLARQADLKPPSEAGDAPAAKPKAAKKPDQADSLRDLAVTKTPMEEYRRRRKLLKYDLDIGADGLDSKFARYDRRKQAVFFAQMLATRQFDNFSSDRVWRAARMESRITFINALLAIHSKVYGFTPTTLDDRFYETVSNMPSSVFNVTGNTSYDRERGKIMLYPPFWKNEVGFKTMVKECIEQNVRHHVRQLAQLYSNGQLKPDDPRFGQAALFHIQIETYDEMVNALTSAERDAGEYVETAQYVPEGELGFDRFARQIGQSIYEQLADVIDEDDTGARR